MPGFWGSDYWKAEYFASEFYGGEEIGTTYADAALTVVGTGSFTGQAATQSAIPAMGGTLRKHRRNLSWPKNKDHIPASFADAALTVTTAAQTAMAATGAIGAALAVAGKSGSAISADALEHNYDDETFTWLMAA